MIKILTGYSDKGGSTTAFINLTNYLNSIGVNCVLYGPNTWHLDKCKSDLSNNIIYNVDDVVLLHYINLDKRLDVKKVIYVCHEKWWFNFSKINNIWDIGVFLHEEHIKFHKEFSGEYVIIPNLKETLTPKEKPELDLVAGIIGTIEERKQTHISIQRALKDKCTKILLYGNVGNENYFHKNVQPLLSNNRIELMGYVEDKQKIYDSIGRVYHSSKGEVACLVKDECYLTNTKFFGNDETNNIVSRLTNQEIISLWLKLFEL